VADQTKQQKLAEMVANTAGPTSAGLSAKVVQTGQLGTYALEINGDHVQARLYGSFEDLERLFTQISTDLIRHREMTHVWWTPEVEA
jgi:hypothetical protein